MPGESMEPERHGQTENNMRRWAVECIAAVGCFLANIGCHAAWAIWDISRILGNRVPFAIYVQAVTAALPLGQLLVISGMSIFVGVLIGLGLGRVWVPRRRAAIVFVAGALVSIGGFVFLASLKALHPTTTILWSVMLGFSVLMPWFLGRLIARTCGAMARDQESGESVS